MRISIWQQCSSNHSSSFTIVGEFKTDEDANAAYQTWYELITSVTDWWKQRDQSLHWDRKQGPSEPEIAFSEKYGIDWQGQAIDWFGLPDELAKVLYKVGNHVFVSVEFETWQPPTLAENIMVRLGGKTIKQTSEDIELIVNLTCTAPDKTALDTVYGDLVSRIRTAKSGSSLHIPPWDDHWRGHSLYRLDQDGNQLSLSLSFFRLSRVLPKMIRYFEELGFTDFELTFQEKEYTYQVTCSAPSVEKAQEIKRMIETSIENQELFAWQRGGDFVPGKTKVSLQIEENKIILDVVSTREVSEGYHIKQFLVDHNCVDLNHRWISFD